MTREEFKSKYGWYHNGKIIFCNNPIEYTRIGLDSNILSIIDYRAISTFWDGMVQHTLPEDLFQ